MRDSNSSMEVLLFSNSYQEEEDDPLFETMVRGAKVNFDEDAINKFLGTPAPLICGI